MNIVEPSVELWQQESGVKGMYDHIEKCARICYRSENKGKVTSEQFVKSLIKNRHWRCCEFGTVALPSPRNPYEKLKWWLRSIFNPWVKHDAVNHLYITNLRYVIERYPKNWEKQIANMADVDVNMYRPTIHWHNISRGIADEFRTHVMLSSLMESTRYVNYRNVGLQFTKPRWYNDKGDMYDCTRARRFFDMCETVELAYKECLENGHKPETAREILPLCTSTNFVQCGFNDAWDNFFYLRCAKAAHVDAQYLASMAISVLNNIEIK